MLMEEEPEKEATEFEISQTNSAFASRRFRL
jgi:hypothetical protein